MASMKIVFAGNAGPQLVSLKQEFPSATFAAAPDLETQLRELPDADAIISWPQREALQALIHSAEVEGAKRLTSAGTPVNGAPKLKWVHCTSAGIERIKSLPELAEM